MASSFITPGLRSLPADEDLLEVYDSKRWGCYSCSKPSVVIYRPADKNRPELFECRVNHHAPFANSINCASYEMIPGIDDLWKPEDNPVRLAQLSAEQG